MLSSQVRDWDISLSKGQMVFRTQTSALNSVKRLEEAGEGDDDAKAALSYSRLIRTYSSHSNRQGAFNEQQKNSSFNSDDRSSL